MKPSAFESLEAQRRLYSVALSWIGTPFVAHAMIKGAGVDCVSLAAAVYVESGLVLNYSAPPYSLDGGNHLNLSKIVTWIEASGRFEEVPDKRALIGDVLLFKMGRVDHHVGIKITESTFVQALRRYGVVESNCKDPTWARRLSRVYQPSGGIA